MKTITTVASACLVASCFSFQPAYADWQPTKPIEFIVAAAPGGGTDIAARTIQAIITSRKLIDQPISVINKPGGSGAEGYTYMKSLEGDPYHLIFGTAHTWQQPLVSKVSYRHSDFTPVAIMAQDPCLLWVKGDSPYKTVQDYLKAATTGELRMGGGQSKDTDEILTRTIARVAKVNLVYIPFRSGGEAAVQLAGGHVDSNVNNPSENIGHWKSGTQRPLCVFATERLPEGPKVTETQGWHDIPTCIEAGLDIPRHQEIRTVWMPGKVTPDQLAFYVDVMKKVQESPEWQDYINRTLQSKMFLTGTEFQNFITTDEKRLRQIATDEGWLVKN